MTRATKRLGRRVVLDGVDLEAMPGDVIGLVGPNGAGKSTLLRAIAGVCALDAGEILVGGRFDPRRCEGREHLGYVPQEIALYARLTADENLRFFGALSGVHGRALDVRVDEALAFVGLVDRRRDRVEQLSGGMKRRLNLAAAILHRPSLLLLDEPTVGVDAEARAQLLDDVRTLARGGAAVLLATHLAEDIAEACTHFATMRHGKLLSVHEVDRERARSSSGVRGGVWGNA